jgi:phosphohistidine phosphatase SixA
MKISLVSVLVFVGVMAAAAAARAQDDVVHALRKGGYVLFLRHTATNPDQADTDPLNLDNIKAQRQLMDEGRNQAKALGAALRQFKIPVGKILASKFYRARETAELLDLGEVETVLDITEGGLVVSPRENRRRAAALRTLLATAPPEGKNTIIVSHRSNLQDVAGKEFGDLGEGEIVVFQPLSEGKFKLVARVAPSSQWAEWAK